MLLEQVRIAPVRMIRVRGFWHEPFFAFTDQFLELHDPQHALSIHKDAFSGQEFGDSPVPMPRVFEYELLDFIAQEDVFFADWLALS